MQSQLVLYWLPGSRDEIRHSDLLVSRMLALYAMQCVGMQVIRPDDDVMIEKFDETGELRRVHASIVVEKDAHKAMVIGAGGEKLKAIASGARRDMEKLFGGKVYLEVWVKVRRGWTDDEAALGRLGYD